jgi:hypothetical protein
MMLDRRVGSVAPNIVPGGFGSWLVARGSWLVARGSWLVARGSWLVARGSWLVARGSLEERFTR